MKTLSKRFKIKSIIAVVSICSAIAFTSSEPAYAEGVSNTTKILHEHKASGTLVSGTALSDNAVYSQSGGCYTKNISESHIVGYHACWTGTKGNYDYKECPNGHPACAQSCGCHTAGCPYMCHCNGAKIHPDTETQSKYSKSCPFDNSAVIQELTLSSDGKGKLNITVSIEALVTSYKIYKGSTLLTTSSSYQTISPGTYTAEITTIDSQTSQKRTGSVSITTTEEEYLKATLSANIETTETSWTNEDVTLTVEANADVNYKWYRNGDEIFGAVENVYVVDDFSNGDEFYCQVTRKDNQTISLNTNKIYVYLDNEKPTLESTGIFTYTEDYKSTERAHCGLEGGGTIYWASQNLYVSAGMYKDKGSGVAFCDLYKGCKDEGGVLISHSLTPSDFKVPGVIFTTMPKLLEESGTYCLYIIDKAGNELCVSYDIYIDKELPSISQFYQTKKEALQNSEYTYTGEYSLGSWTNADRIVIQGYENDEVIKTVSGTSVTFTDNGLSPEESIENGIICYQEGSHEIEMLLTTGSGLTKSIKGYVKIDRSAPSVSLKISEAE